MEQPKSCIALRIAQRRELWVFGRCCPIRPLAFSEAWLSLDVRSLHRAFMKSRRKPEADSAKDFMEQLVADRGTILTDEEYESMRSFQLQMLARPPRVEWAVAGPGVVCILVGVGLLVAALRTWITASEDTTMNRLMIGLLFLGLGSYFFFGNLHVCGAAYRRPFAERLSEVDDLLRSGLITPQEHESIRQTIEQQSALRFKMQRPNKSLEN